MAKIKKRKLIWEPSTSPNVIGYKLYWAEEGEVNYDSPSAMIGNINEVVLPGQVPSFPVVKGSIELGITAVNEMGNESDMMIVAAPFQFSTPDAPADPKFEVLKEYHFCQGLNTNRGDKKSATDITGPDRGADLSPGTCREPQGRTRVPDNLPVQEQQTSKIFIALDRLPLMTSHSSAKANKGT